MPVYAQKSLDTVVSEMLAPLMQYEMHQGLRLSAKALGLPWARDLLPDIETQHKCKVQSKASGSGFAGSQQAGMPAGNVGNASESLADAEDILLLQADFEKKNKTQAYKAMAENIEQERVPCRGDHAGPHR